MNLGLQEIALIVVVLLLLFGAKRLPSLAKALGQSIKDFKKGLASGSDDDSDSSTKDLPS